MKDFKQIEEENQARYLEILSQIDPELWLIKMALVETRLNPTFIPKIIRAISNLLIGSGYGIVKIFMKARIIKQIDSNESVVLDEPGSVE